MLLRHQRITQDLRLHLVHPKCFGLHFLNPSPEVIERLEGKPGSENIYRTDKHGTIEFATDGEKLWVKKGK